MSRNILNFFSVVMVSGLLLAAPSVQAQTQSGSPLAGQNGSLNRNGMSPYMKPNGPMAPQNNVQFIERNTFGGMSRNIRVETSMSQLALKNSHNADIKKFARQVIVNNRRIEDQLAVPPSSDGPDFASETSIQTEQARKKMEKLSGTQFDQIYLKQMDGYVRKDQQAGHAAYAMMDLSKVSHVGSQVWALSNERAKQIATLAKEAGFKID